MNNKHSVGFVSLAILAIVFVVTSLVGLGAGKQVKKTQVSQPKAACDKPEGCGGQCNPSVNQGCYVGGCRAWEWCNGNGMCEWEQQKIGVNQKCEQKQREGTILPPGQSSQQQTQPTQAQQQAQPTASAGQNTTTAGSCDPKWYCLGECAGPTPKAAFGNNDAQWRRAKANNEGKSGACDNPATTQTQQQAQPTQSQQQAQPTPTQTPTSAPATGGIQPTAQVQQQAQPTQPATSKLAATGTSCYTSKTDSFPHGFCTPAGSAMLFCNNASNATPQTSNNTYIGWQTDTYGICTTGSKLCIGIGAKPTDKYACCSKVLDDNGRCSQTGTAVTNAPTQAPVATNAPAQVSSTGGTTVPTTTPSPTAVGITGVATSVSTLKQGTGFTVNWNDTTSNNQYRLYLLIRTSTAVSNRFFTVTPETKYVRQSNRYLYQYTLTVGEVNTFYNAVLAEKNKPNSQITGLKIAIRRADKSSAIDFDNEPGVPIALIDQQATVASATTPTPVVTAVASTPKIAPKVTVRINPSQYIVGSGGNTGIFILSNFKPEKFLLSFMPVVNGTATSAIKFITLDSVLLEQLAVGVVSPYTNGYNYIVKTDVLNELANTAKTRGYVAPYKYRVRAVNTDRTGKVISGTTLYTLSEDTLTIVP